MIVHAHTHAGTHACTPAHTDTLISIHIQIHAHRQTHTLVHLHTSLILTPMYTPALTHIHSQQCSHTRHTITHRGCTLTCTFTRAQAHALSHTLLPQPGSPLSGKPGTVTCPAHTQVEALRNYLTFIGSRHVAPKDLSRVPVPHMVETFENTLMF